MSATLATETGNWTYDRYFALDDDQRYEVIAGKLRLMPSPGLLHQMWVGELFDIIRGHVRAAGAGHLFFSPVDVILDQENVVQPDLIYVSKENSAILRPRGVFGPPDLAVEIVSPHHQSRDRVKKLRLYARFGVREFWLVDPARRSIEVLALRDGKYETHCRAVLSGVIRSAVLPGLSFDIPDVAL